MFVPFLPKASGGAFSGKQAGKHGVHIACGSTSSAAITVHRGPRELRLAGQGTSALREWEHAAGGGLSQDLGTAVLSV